MKITRDDVRRLTTKEEAEFLEGLTAGRIEQITPTRLRQKLDRARRLRDKYRDLARRQRGEMRGKAEPRSTRPARSNDNTLRKVQLFEWAIHRITSRLEAAGKAPDTGGRSPDDASTGGKGRERTRASEDYSPDQLQARVVEVLKETESLSFGDLWAEMPDVPVDLLRKALWALSEAGAIDLTDDAGVALATERDVAEDVEVEVELDRPAAPTLREARAPVVGRRGKGMPGESGHHPKTRIHSHIRGAGRRNQARRDRRG
jgi:hypothetical protein